MKKLYTAVTILIALAITESCRKQQVDKIIAGQGHPAQKEIKQSHQGNASIHKVDY
ncbi:hypothetical protein GCM10023149_36100 [Mucilaginibacter gynuensis]|uniref:Uncharacterized protein n=1 Tax=Mucilaginibacter gynuensis TaxID=1302236 RepID=A0ABP8GVX4_9SPHI